jgi:hypothetical protein
MADNDREARVVAFLHGLVRNPGRAFLTEEERQRYLAWIPADASKPSPPPPGSRVRVRTIENMVETIESRPGDGASIKLYGPFATAAKQREFMANVWRSYLEPGPKLDEVLRATAAWRREDEE